MKSEIYNTLAALNRGADLILESLTILKQEGIWDADYVMRQTELLEHQRSGINRLAHNVLQGRETESEYDFGKMAERTARNLKENAQGLPASNTMKGKASKRKGRRQ